MSEEQFKAFWEAIQQDAALQQKLFGVMDPDVVVEIAKEAGFSISADDLNKQQFDLSDEDLSGMAGGAFSNNACVFTLLCIQVTACF
jgi:predicted ribosomally synthesized peptide with nif11-like leader